MFGRVGICVLLFNLCPHVARVRLALFDFSDERFFVVMSTKMSQSVHPTRAACCILSHPTEQNKWVQSIRSCRDRLLPPPLLPS